MKKLLLATLFAAGAMAPMTAQELYLEYKGEPVANGETIVYDGITTQTFDVMPGYTLWTIDPELNVIATEDTDITINVTSNLEIQLCTLLDPDDPNSGACLQGDDVEKTPVWLEANDPRELRLDVQFETYAGETELEIPEYNVVITMFNNDDPDNVYTVNLKMGGFMAAGVESLATGKNIVSFQGNVLSYDLPSASQISVYSLSGRTLLQKNVGGSGTLNLEGLAKGVYLYRVSGKYSKAAKIIIK